MFATLRPTALYFLRPIKILRHYSFRFIKPDLIAGGTVAIVLLPQAIAYALIAELPVQAGLYAAIVAATVGALWGSSYHLHTGPTNVAALLALSVLLTVSQPGTAEYVAAAGLMAVIVGIIRMGMGVARLGVLVNFISDSVIVGFTAGAGVLIGANQLKHLLRLTFPSAPDLYTTLKNVTAHFSEFHLVSLELGLGTIVLILLLKWLAPKWPSSLLAMAAASAVVWALGLDEQGVMVIGQLPHGLPPLSDLSFFVNWDLLVRVTPPSLAVAAIGLVEAISIGRSVATQSGQRLDSNQEFVGQGLANIAAGLFSGFLCSGSFTRSGVNYEAGAKTPMSSVFSSVFVLLAMFVLAPLAVYIPRTALAGVLILASYSLVDRKEIARLWRGTRGDTIIMMATLLATLLFPLEYAVLTGILFSFARYAVDTSLPQVKMVLPDDNFNHLIPRPNRPCCPQLGIMDIMGELYFGAVSHVEEIINQNSIKYPEQRFLLLRMRSVNHCDINGVHMLEAIMRTYRDRGGDLYLMRVTEPVMMFMESTGFYDVLGKEHFLPDDDAVTYLFEHILDPAICIYECEVRAFKECQSLPKKMYHHTIPLHTAIPARSITEISAKMLHERLTIQEGLPLVVDVREPREYKQAHIPGSLSMPLSHLLVEMLDLQPGRQVVFVCRSGRRSARAAYMLQQQGVKDVAILKGGILTWENAGYLEAIVP